MGIFDLERGERLAYLQQCC